MYAEGFKVRTWLEGPAKWLNWALAAMVQRNLKDAHYNLGKFWEELEPLKARQLSARQWGELMTLDSQANWALGNWYDAAGLVLLQAGNAAGGVSSLMQFVLPQVAAGQWIAERMGWNPARDSVKTALDDLQAKRAAAYQTSKTLADKAVAALKASNSPLGQAANTATVTAGAVSSTPSREAFEEGILSQTFKPILDELPEALRAPFGIAWYWWAAGAAALVLLPILLAPTPRVTIGGD